MKNIYRTLSGNKLLADSYTYKFLFVAFLGIHVPLLGLIVLISFIPHELTPTVVLLTALALTLAATAITLWILRGLLNPIVWANAALRAYKFNRVLPDLPIHHPDEAGQLMRDVQLTVTELNDLLEEKKVLSEFITHDMKMPILNIRLMANAIPEARENTEKLNTCLANIQHSLEEQEGLLNQVINLIRQDDSIAISMQRKNASLNDSIVSAIKSLQPLAADKQITIDFKPEKDFELQLAPEIFQQAIKNIIHNAIKFSHTGSTVQLLTRSSSNAIIFECIDQGVGFAAEGANRLFDKMKKGQRGTAGEESTGLGLYLTRKILEGHNAIVSATSDGPGKGASFKVSIYQD